MLEISFFFLNTERQCSQRSLNQTLESKYPQVCASVSYVKPRPWCIFISCHSHLKFTSPCKWICFNTAGSEAEKLVIYVRVSCTLRPLVLAALLIFTITNIEETSSYSALFVRHGHLSLTRLFHPPPPAVPNSPAVIIFPVLLESQEIRCQLPRL